EASDIAVSVLSKALGVGFREAYMLASLVVDLKINQVVDPKKGVRAAIPKDIVSSIEPFLLKEKH
ncbi:MAG: formamidase, partial [Thermoprotei archaeon]